MGCCGPGTRGSGICPVCCSVCSSWKVWRQGHAAGLGNGRVLLQGATGACAQPGLWTQSGKARGPGKRHTRHRKPRLVLPQTATGPQHGRSLESSSPSERGALTARQSWGPSLRADLRKATEPCACHGPPWWPGRPVPSSRSPSPGISRGSCRGPWALGSNSSPNTCFKNKGPT